MAVSNVAVRAMKTVKKKLVVPPPNKEYAKLLEDVFKAELHFMQSKTQALANALMAKSLKKSSNKLSDVELEQLQKFNTELAFMFLNLFSKNPAMKQKAKSYIINKFNNDELDDILDILEANVSLIEQEMEKLLEQYPILLKQNPVP